MCLDDFARYASPERHYGALREHAARERQVILSRESLIGCRRTRKRVAAHTVNIG